jgi:hypothetical protein
MISQQLDEQIRLSMYGIEKPITQLQTSTGTKDPIAQYWINILLTKARQLKAANTNRSSEDIAMELRTWFDEQPGDKKNPLLSVHGMYKAFILLCDAVRWLGASIWTGLDPSQDTPVEILHTVLLGIVKYLWHNLHTSWTEADQDLFTIRLQSTNIDGLSIPPIRAAYMIWYKNGLIGKHFKTLMQTAIFHLHGLVTPDQFTLVKAIGFFCALLWIPEIENMESYLVGITFDTRNL